MDCELCRERRQQQREVGFELVKSETSLTPAESTQRLQVVSETLFEEKFFSALLCPIFLTHSKQTFIFMHKQRNKQFKIGKHKRLKHMHEFLITFMLKIRVFSTNLSASSPFCSPLPSLLRSFSFMAHKNIDRVITINISLSLRFITKDVQLKIIQCV